ncbi:hypothetical protein LAZ67_6003233 [Cordylochernes scorpioides]|uniref:ATP-dependent DNA helicase n=1 Tax=Cordylochernes scorpioides TaxID=51811 RepID=A0ABY6KMA0_9ARAC|nr:hypothetical protein LAZ67_6003233 [Cordylochernes scorpioides]
MLLRSVRGPTSFAALRTINGVLCQTYKEAFLHLGLAENDQKWHHCIQEAVLSESPLKIRELFAIILTCCHTTNPQDIWAQFKEPMSADILNLARHQANDGLLQLTSEMSNQALILLEQKVLQMTGFHLTKFGMRSTQRNVTHRTRKTFLINLLLTKVRSTGDIALSTASSGIAATLLHGGRTAHSTFKLPLDLTRDEVPVCNLNADSAMGEVLRQCKLIVWDECTMAHRHALEAVDITLKDCRQDQRPMGGIVLLLAGDFRQILPIIPRGTIVLRILYSIALRLRFRILYAFALRLRFRILYSVALRLIFIILHSFVLRLRFRILYTFALRLRFRILHSRALRLRFRFLYSFVLRLRFRILFSVTFISCFLTFRFFSFISFISVFRIHFIRFCFRFLCFVFSLSFLHTYIAINCSFRILHFIAFNCRFCFLPFTAFNCCHPHFGYLLKDLLFQQICGLSIQEIPTHCYFHNFFFNLEVANLIIRMVMLIFQMNWLTLLCNSVFPNIGEMFNRGRANYYPWLCERAILAPRNCVVDAINAQLLKEIPGQSILYTSVDSTIDAEDCFLNSLEPSGMPPHHLELRVGVPIILLRDIDAPCLCNGTRLCVKRLWPHVAEATILTGCFQNEEVFIPRIPLIHDNKHSPLHFKRLQFPIRVSFAMSIYKAQGQSLKIAGIDLEQPCFSHGQLYVACYRVGSGRNLYVLAPENKTSNFVYSSVLS